MTTLIQNGRGKVRLLEQKEQKRQCKAHYSIASHAKRTNVKLNLDDLAEEGDEQVSPAFHHSLFENFIAYRKSRPMRSQTLAPKPQSQITM